MRRQLMDGADAEGDVDAPKPPPSKKRRTNASTGEAGKSGKLLEKGKEHPVGTIEIQPGESLKHFNRYAFVFLPIPRESESPFSLPCLVCVFLFLLDV